jgi:hypothetical protein
MNLSDLNALSDIAFSLPATATATITGAAIDLQQYIGVLKVSQHVGAVSGTTPTLDGKIQDSADGSTFADLATPLAFTEVTASTNTQALQVDTRAVRRYVRYVGTIAGTTPSYAVGVHAVGLEKTV